MTTHAEANRAHAALMQDTLQRLASDGMTPAAVFLAWLGNGYKPSAQELEALAYALHDTTANLPEINWMAHSFEQVGDSLHKAIEHAAWAREFCADRTDKSIYREMYEVQA